jgi:hypothetical protein
MARTEIVQTTPPASDLESQDEGVAQESEFHMEEYRALRAEVLLLKQQQFATQKWTIVSLGIIYGLTFGVTGGGAITILPKVDRQLLVLAGVIISAIGAGFYSISDYTMNNISKYVKEIEVYFIKKGCPKGWEHFQGIGTKRRQIWGVRRNPFWWCTLLFSTFLALYEILVPRP